MLANVYSEKRYASVSRSFQLNPLYYISPQAESTHLFFKFIIVINVQSIHQNDILFVMINNAQFLLIWPIHKSYLSILTTNNKSIYN